MEKCESLNEICTGAGQLLDLVRRLDDLEVVAQPPHGFAGNGHCSLERIAARLVGPKLERYSCQQPVPRHDHLERGEGAEVETQTRKQDRRQPTLGPVLYNRKQPVPYVFFASPISKQCCPKSAACWSPKH